MELSQGIRRDFAGVVESFLAARRSSLQSRYRSGRETGTRRPRPRPATGATSTNGAAAPKDAGRARTPARAPRPQQEARTGSGAGYAGGQEARRRGGRGEGGSRTLRAGRTTPAARCRDPEARIAGAALPPVVRGQGGPTPRTSLGKEKATTTGAQPLSGVRTLCTGAKRRLGVRTKQRARSTVESDTAVPSS